MSTAIKQRVIDTHLHFWDAATYYRLHNDWLDTKPELKRSFLPPDLKPHFEACGVDSGIIVEAGRDSHALNLWLLQLAQDYDYIGAVVAGCWVDNKEIDAWLDEYMESPYFVGVRTQPPGNPESWMQNDDVRNVLNQLVRRNLSLDLFVTYDMFSGVAQLAAHYPDLPIIINHCANPPYREGNLGGWKAQSQTTGRVSQYLH